ncbi:MAG: trp operon repressor [Chlamydiae bacterium]|nr:trp operon repressor [Chlamydiota bacterium]
MRLRDEEGWKMFLDLCLETKNTSRLEELLGLFLTIEEKDHLSSRMQIIRALLSEELSQREISEAMKVSISQITRGSNALKIISDDLLKFLENYVRRLEKK